MLDNTFGTVSKQPSRWLFLQNLQVFVQNNRERLSLIELMVIPENPGFHFFPYNAFREILRPLKQIHLMEHLYCHLLHLDMPSGYPPLHILYLVFLKMTDQSIKCDQNHNERTLCPVYHTRHFKILLRIKIHKRTHK